MSGANEENNMETTRYSQPSVRNSVVSGSLGVSGVLSPYFQMIDTRKVGTPRDTNIFAVMNVNAIVDSFTEFSDHIGVVVSFFDTSDNFISNNIVSLAGISLVSGTWAFIQSAVSTYATGQGNTLVSLVSEVSMNAAVRTVNTPTRVLNTAYTPSSTLPTMVIMSVEIDASLSLTGGTKGTVTLLASNNSFSTSTAESETVNGNTGTLTIGLNTVGAGGGTVIGFVPAGWAYKAVTASSTGTATFSVLSTTEIVGI